MTRRLFFVRTFIPVMMTITGARLFGTKGRPVFWIYTFQSSAEDGETLATYMRDREKYEDSSVFDGIIRSHSQSGGLISHRTVLGKNQIRQVYHFADREAAEAWEADVIRAKNLKGALVHRSVMQKELGIEIKFMEVPV